MAAGFKIGDAFIEVRADASRVPGDIERVMGQVDGDRVGRSLGSRIGNGVGSGIGASLLGGGGGGGIVGSTLAVMSTRFGIMAVAAAGAGAVLTQLSGVIGLLPAAGMAGGLAMGTLALATSGFGEAMKATGDPAAFAAALAKLSPNAQAAASSLRNLVPAWNSVKMAVQDNFFAGLGPMFTTLAGTYLPMLQSSMMSVASGMNGMIRGIGAEFALAGRQADMRLILDASAASVNNLLAAARPIVSVFLDLAAVGAPILQQLTSHAAGLATRFAEFISKARESGQLGTWIQTGLQAFRDLWTILGLLGGTVVNLIAALGGPSSLLGVLTLVAGALNTVSSFIRENISWLGPLAAGIGSVVLAFKAWQMAQAALHAFSMMMLFTNPWMLLVGAVVAAVVLIIMNWDKVKSFLSATWEFIKSAASAAWNWVKSTITSIVSGIASTITSVWNGIKNFISGVLNAISNTVSSIFNGIKNVASSVWNAIKSVISGAVSGIQSAIAGLASLPGKISGWFNSAKSAATSAMGGLVSMVAGIPGRILGALGNLGGMLVNSGRALIDGLGRGISSAFNAVKSKVSGMMSSLRNLFPFSPAKEGPFSGKGYTTYSGKALATDFAKGITGQGSRIQSAVEGVMGSAQAGFNLGSVASVAGGGGTAAMPMGATTTNHSTVISSLTLQIAGNLDPTNPTAYRQAISNIRDGIRAVERSER